MAGCKNKLVSIIIPNYNKGTYLKRCLQSIISYSGDEIEIIIIDDGSTDNSLEILYSIKDNRICVISQKNQGVSVARNQGINIAKGEFILFCDSDDYYEEGALLFLVNYLKKNDDVSDMTLFKFCFKKEGRKITLRNHLFNKLLHVPNISDVLIGLYLDGFFNSPFSKVYKKSVCEKNDIKFPEGIKTGEDGIFNITYLLYCKNISVLDKELYCYCYGESNNCSEKTSVIYKQLEQLKVKSTIRSNLLEIAINKGLICEKEIPYILKLQNNYIRLCIYSYIKNKSNREVRDIKKRIRDDGVLWKAIQSPVFTSRKIVLVLKNLIVKIRFKFL